MPGPETLTRDVDIDVAGLLREVGRRWWLVLGLPLALGAVLFVFLSSMDPSYRSSARVIIEKRESVFTRRTDGDFTLSGSQFDEQAVGSQVEILTSADLALKVIEKLDLTRHPEFAGSQPSMLDGIFSMFGANGGISALTPQERILADFNERLSVYAVEKSRVIAIEFWAHDRELAQKVPNALADEFLLGTQEAQLQTTEEATGWLGTEIEELRQKVRAAEAKVAEFRSSSDLLVSNNNALLATQQLSETSSELSRVRSERSSAEGKVAAVRAALDEGASVDILPEVIASPLIQRLRERQVAIDAQISELETTLLPNHPRLKALKSQSVDYQKQIREAARNILKSLEGNVALIRKQEAVLLQEVNRLKAEAGRVGEAEVELRALEREAAAQRELLETYLSRFREAASRQNRDYLPVDARIISRAVTPSDSFFPKVVPFTVSGVVATLVLTITGILAWALLTGHAFRAAESDFQIPLRGGYPEVNERVSARRREEGDDAGGPVSAASAPVTASAERLKGNVERLPDRVGEDRADAEDPGFWDAFDNRAANRVASQPAAQKPDYAEHLDAALRLASDRMEPRGNRVAASDRQQEPVAAAPASAPASAYPSVETFSLSDALRAIMNMDRARIAIVSPAGDEGSPIAWELVRQLAEAGRSTLVVDLTGSAITSEEFTGSRLTPGLRELLAHKLPLREAVQLDRASSALVLPAGDGPDAGPEALARLQATARALGDAFDFVVFDCGLAGAEGLRHIAPEDSIVFISSMGASEAELADAEHEFRNAGYGETIIVGLEGAMQVSPAASAA